MISNKTVTHEGLVDGAAYTFVYKGIEGSKGAGFYAEDENCLCLVGCLCLLEDCTNIRPMTMEESKFNTGDEIVRVKFFQAYAPDGYKATVLKGYCFLDAEGDTPNIVDDHWELAENTSKSQSVLDHKYIKKMLDKASLPCPRAVIDSVQRGMQEVEVLQSKIDDLQNQMRITRKANALRLQGMVRK